MTDDFSKRAAEAAGNYTYKGTNAVDDLEDAFIAGAEWAERDLVSKDINKVSLSNDINCPECKRLWDEGRRLWNERNALKAELEQANLKIEELTKRDFQEMVETGLYEAAAKNRRL